MSIRCFERKFISKHWRGRGYKTILYVTAREADTVIPFIRYFNIREPLGSWSKTWIKALKKYIEELPEADRTLFHACEAEYFEKEYGKPQEFINNIMRIYEITENLNKRPDSPNF